MSACTLLTGSRGGPLEAPMRLWHTSWARHGHIEIRMSVAERTRCRAMTLCPGRCACYDVGKAIICTAVMVSENDDYRSAKLIVDQHGEATVTAAARYAEGEVRRLRAIGDTKGAAMWRRTAERRASGRTEAPTP